MASHDSPTNDGFFGGLYILRYTGAVPRN